MARGLSQWKWRLARLLNVSGVSRLLLAAETARHRQTIRVVNCHATPTVYRNEFQRQLQFYQQHYCNVTLDDLHGLVYEGRWDKPRPGLVITFDDGLYSNYRVAAPLLEQYGFTGWFFIPTEFLSTPPALQGDFARRNNLAVGQELLDPESQERLAMTWDEARDLAGRHVIGSHTRHHCRMVAELTPAQIEDEIVGSRRILEEKLQVPIRSYCWVGGESDTYSTAAARQIVAAGYEFAFVTTSAPIPARHDPFQLHRTNVDPEWDLDRVRFQLSGIMDFANRRKRQRVAQLTSTTGGR